MKDNKDLEREKIDADEIRIEIETKNPFLSKLSNFWYYHKWKVIIGMFFALRLLEFFVKSEDAQI